MQSKKISLLIFLLSLFILTGAACNKPKDLFIFKTSDSGQAWEQKAKTDKNKSLSSTSVLSIAIDPQNPQNILTGTIGNGILKSQNNGDNWSASSLKQGNVNSITYDPKNSSNIYAAVSLGNLGKIYKSTDGGANFSEIYSETHAKVNVNSILVDHYNPKTVYAGTTAGGFLKSADSGKSWLATNWFNGPIQVMGMSPIDSRLIYVAIKGRYVYKTKDGGKTWLDLKTSLEEYRGANVITAIAFDPKNVDRVYLGSQFGVVITKDSGKTWIDSGLLVEPGKLANVAIAVSPKNPGTIYVGVDTTIHKTINYAKNWNVKKITNNNITCLSIDPKNPQNVYAGVQEIKD